MINELLEITKGQLTIRNLQEVAWQNSEAKGFHKQDDAVPLTYVVSTKIALVVEELGETMSALRDKNQTEALWFDANHDNKPEGVAAELADAVIRIADLAGILTSRGQTVDLEAAIIEKMRYNERRAYLHGNKRI